ncbi:hypothetical protein NM208_g13970 [Fusarium decemcellulare]|uniref:Uncharacterized protein n=1 Tax=Fusarium decemcellulare TaxID=57161 RepID=A0ACC1RJM7_9HYPO|nr:hypothetical protein NM208_g13970 [Fusarium decemcellulare]
MSSFTGAAIGSSAAAQYNSVFSPDQLASMWANLQGQLKDSATKNLILQGAFYRSLDQGAKAYIAHKLISASLSCLLLTAMALTCAISELLASSMWVLECW